MDPVPTGDEAEAPAGDAAPSAPDQSLVQPSSSEHSDVPTTETVKPPETQDSPPKASTDDAAAPSSFQEPQISAQTESLVKRINDNAANAAAAGTPGWEAAKEQVMKDMQTSDKFPSPAAPEDPPAASQPNAQSENGNGGQITFKIEGDAIQVTPTSTGRGRGGGRPRGRGRGGGRGGKRKRGSNGSDFESEDSEVYSPVVTTTKSGRSVQKPSAFVPPPQSPTTSNKRKRPYNRKNPESAVCKICLRGTSPANNMIVFCDGCNTPYHRYCHHPPIDQAVVDEVDKEWYCKQCEKERVLPVPDSEVANFISAEGAPLEQRQRYFASLPPGMLVTLLTRATTLKPDLPVFAPDFRARIGSNTSTAPPAVYPVSNGYAHPSQPAPHHPNMAPVPTTFPSGTHSVSQASVGASHGNMHYMHPSEQHSYGPDVHPPNYPRPGHGLMRTLPPEQEDLQWLVDDDDRYGVFSHMYQVDPRAANAGMNSGGGMGHVR